MKIYIKADEYDEELDDDQRKWIKDQAAMKKDNPAIWPSKDQVHDDIINLLCYNDNYKKYDIDLNDIQVKRIKHYDREFYGLNGLKERTLWELDAEALILYNEEEFSFCMDYYQYEDNTDYYIFDDSMPEPFKENYPGYENRISFKNMKSEDLCKKFVHYSSDMYKLKLLKDVLNSVEVGDDFDGYVVKNDTIWILNNVYSWLSRGSTAGVEEWEYDDSIEDYCKYSESAAYHILTEECKLNVIPRGRYNATIERIKF